MGVDVYGHAQLAVAEHLLHRLQLPSETQQHCGGAVAQIVEADVGKPCLLELHEHVARGMQIAIDRACKDEIVLRP